VRNLEREIGRVCRKITRRLAENKPAPRQISRNGLHRYLGPPQFTENLAQEADEVGVAIGIAWTGAGGDLMPVEVSLMEGKGNITLTGQLGEVMQESAQAAFSYARAHADILDINTDLFDQFDVHIHVPEGAIPKDGPSAGVTLATALISALTNRPVHHEVAMTGEITLRGRILPVGGLKEKSMAAHRAGIKTILVPQRNKKDMVDIPKKIQRDLNFVFVDQMDGVLPVALASEPLKPARRPTKKDQD
jgi:ATP-dependent Lon protease